MKTLPTINLFSPIDEFKDYRNNKGQFTKGNANQFQQGNKAAAGLTNSGRPTKCTEDALKKAEEYLRKCRTNKKIPFTQELALELEISRETLNEWKSEKNEDGSLKHREFSDIIESMETYQELALLNRGLAGKVPRFVEFLLSRKYGYIDTTKQIQVGDKENPVHEKLEIVITEAKRHE